MLTKHLYLFWKRLWGKSSFHLLVSGNTIQIFNLHSNSVLLEDLDHFRKSVCEEGPQLYPPRLQVEGHRDATGVTMSGVRPHAPVNHSFLLYHGFIIFMYINKILMKTTPQFFYILSVNYFVLIHSWRHSYAQCIWILPVSGEHVCISNIDLITFSQFVSLYILG